MSDTGQVMCALPSCSTLAPADKEFYRNGLPYCSKFCFDRAYQSSAQAVPLEENRP